MSKPKNRKSSIYTDKKLFSYYQTMSYDKTYGHVKGRIYKYIGKNLTAVAIKKKQKELDEHFNQVDTNTIIGNPVLKQPETLEKVLKTYEKYNQKRVQDMEISRITCGNHTGFMKQFLKYMDLKHKSIHIARINTQHIKDYVIFRRKQRLSENTIRNDLTYIKTFFKWCFREKYLVGNPYNHEIKMPQYQPRTISHIPVGKEWDILYQFISKSLTFVPTTQNEKRKWTWFNKNIDFKEQIFLMLNTGMRGGEVQILKWKKGDLDYGKPTFPYSHLNRGNKTATIYFKRTLTTDFEFNTATIKMLRNRLDRKHPQDTYVFSNPNTNTRYNNSQLVDSFNRLCEGLGLVDKETQKSLFTPHSLRHGVISQLLRTGVPIQDISKVVARHSKIGTTYDIYGHFQTGKGKSILDSLSNDKDKL